MNDEQNTTIQQKKCDEIDDVNYDQFLRSAGELGKYQVFLFFCTFPFYMFCVFASYSQIFLTEVSPQHWCWIPELQNLTIEERRNLAIPKDENSPHGYSRCQAFDANWTEVLLSGLKTDQKWKKVDCQYGWEFNKTEFAYTTISSELGWVCEKDNYQAAAQSIFFVGSIVGGFWIGWIADRYGRLPAAVISNTLGAIAGTVSAFSQNFIQFAICRFVMGMSFDNCLMMVYLIVLEYTSPKYRTLITNLSASIFFTVGAVAIPWIALACGYWRYVALATSLPMGLSILAPLIIPESPRWLLSKRRINETVKRVLKVAEVNKQIVPDVTIKRFKESALKNDEEPGNMVDLIKRPRLRQMFICTCFGYMCCNICIDALIRTIGQLKYDFFISFSVISLTEFPSIAILSFVLDYVGRKLMLVSTMILCGLFSFMIPFMGGGWSSVICAVFARFFVNMACNTATQWATEMLPTSVRGSGSSIVHICSYIATMMSPFVAYLETYLDWLPMILIGCIAIIAALNGMMLPETAGKELPQTFQAAEELIKQQSLLEIPFLQKKKNKNVMQGMVNPSFEIN